MHRNNLTQQNQNKTKQHQLILDLLLSSSSSSSFFLFLSSFFGRQTYLIIFSRATQTQRLYGGKKREIERTRKRVKLMSTIVQFGWLSLLRFDAYPRGLGLIVQHQKSLVQRASCQRTQYAISFVRNMCIMLSSFQSVYILDSFILKFLSLSYRVP